MTRPPRPSSLSWAVAITILAAAASVASAANEASNGSNKAHDYMLQLSGTATTSSSDKSEGADSGRTAVRAKRLVLQVPNGHDLRLTCKLASGDANSYVLNWYLPGYIDSDRVKKLKSDGVYSITVANITEHDAGHFKCTATRVASSSKKRRKPSASSHEGQMLVYDDADYDDHAEDDEYAEGDYSELVMRDHGQPYDLEKRVTVWVVTQREQSAAHHFACPGTTYGIFPRFVCDGVWDCPDGHDEDAARCGDDPCHGKLVCSNGRCLDPSTCCDPEVDPACPHVPSCCLPIVQHNRNLNMHIQFESGSGAQRADAGESYTIIIYTVFGCLLVIVLVFLVVLVVYCRSQARADRRRRLRERLRLAHLPPDVVSDIDVAFLSLSTRVHHTRAGQNEYVRCPRRLASLTAEGRRPTTSSSSASQAGNASPPPPYRQSEQPPPAYDSYHYSNEMVYIDLSQNMPPPARHGASARHEYVNLHPSDLSNHHNNSNHNNILPRETPVADSSCQSIPTDQSSSSTVLDVERGPDPEVKTEAVPQSAATAASANDEADPLLDATKRNGCDNKKQ